MHEVYHGQCTKHTRYYGTFFVCTSFGQPHVQGVLDQASSHIDQLHTAPKNSKDKGNLPSNPGKAPRTIQDASRMQDAAAPAPSRNKFTKHSGGPRSRGKLPSLLGKAPRFVQHLGRRCHHDLYVQKCAKNHSRRAPKPFYLKKTTPSQKTTLIYIFMGSALSPPP